MSNSRRAASHGEREALIGPHRRPRTAVLRRDPDPKFPVGVVARDELDSLQGAGILGRLSAPERMPFLVENDHVARLPIVTSVSILAGCLLATYPTLYYVLHFLPPSRVTADIVAVCNRVGIPIVMSTIGPVHRSLPSA